MPSLNKVMLIGHLGSEPELKTLANGNTVANVSLAISEKYKKDGQVVDKTEWVKLVFWGRVAEVLGEYATKGSAVYVEGKMQTRSWESEQGKRYQTEVVCYQLQLLSKKERSSLPKPGAIMSQTGLSMSQTGLSKPEPKQEEFDDDIPF